MSRPRLLVWSVVPASLVILVGTIYLFRLFPISAHDVSDAGGEAGKATQEWEVMAAAKRADFISRGVRGFVLAVTVDQQLTGGLVGFTHLATLGAAFNLSTVEPYVDGTNLVGVPHIVDEAQHPNVMELSNLYDFEDMNRNFKTCSRYNDHQLTSFETFLDVASRHVIHVNMITTVKDYNLYFSGRHEGEQIVEIYPRQSSQAGLNKLNKWAALISKRHKKQFHRFHSERVLLMDARRAQPLPFSLILNRLGRAIDYIFSKFLSVTVLFEKWRAIEWRVPETSFYYVPGFTWRVCQQIEKVEHSKAVHNASLLFSQSLNDSVAALRVGVHIRGERLLTEYRGNPLDCLEKLETFLKNFSHYSGMGVRILHDLGDYGTKSCDTINKCVSGRNDFISRVNQLGYPVVSFDPAEFPSFPRSPAFVAFVERDYLADVDVLVTLGWGGFQYTISRKFVKRHGGDTHSLHQICKSSLPRL